ncbi:hypothetical protein L0Z42_29925 (plasmid) [Burkholderia multivorans]|uniref:hypothetical protein n=1 Tax=Burkholderia multivorans TaxID=87883 RepID=UPI0020192226|nr:hypothetical protein [Burkholderia multivorans]MCO1374702.1 hypothetical protein [Burkholderia multivorans]MCO1459996.1 hypothetical protein [Burkholderia multivorans]MCO1470782.1 hypothetical protein [Burkholderia multivorans]UQO21366.1 hypothetical protein L0Z02_29870 [Burkholderia multivorans]UQO87506.1 hypothetical protein L0Y86_29600 [Burkholderia multivorans]
MLNLAIVLIPGVLGLASIGGLLFVGFGLFVGVSVRDGIPWIVASVVGLVVAIVWIRMFAGHVTAKLQRQVQRVAPPGFRPTVEASAPTEGQYIGISKETGSVVVLDKKKGIAKQMPISKVSRWEFVEGAHRTDLVLWFNDLSVPSARVLVPQQHVDDTASRLRTVLGF